METVIDKMSKSEYAVKVDDELVFLFVSCPLFKYSYFLPETNKDQLLKPMFGLHLPRILIKFAMEIHIFFTEYCCSPFCLSSANIILIIFQYRCFLETILILFDRLWKSLMVMIEVPS